MANPNIVNVATINGGSLGFHLTTTAATALITATAEYIIKINSILVANVDGTNAADVSVEFYNGSTAYRIASTVSVPADSTLVILGKDSPIYLEENHSIRGGAGAASDLEIIISYDELDDA